VPGGLLLLLRTVLVSFRGRRDLVLENLALRRQLDVAPRGEPRLRIQQRDRILCVWLRRLWPRDGRLDLAAGAQRNALGAASQPTWSTIATRCMDESSTPRFEG
jgi:hypothetical protein